MSDEARVSYLPYREGDGYSFGGGVILTIGERSLYIGSGIIGDSDRKFAEELARRWNSARAVLDETGDECDRI